jgi:hypothetical protein
MSVLCDTFIYLNKRRQSILVGGDLLRDGSSLIVMVLARGIMTFQGVEAFSVIQMADGLKAMPKRLVHAMLFTQKCGVFTSAWIWLGEIIFRISLLRVTQNS